MKTKSKIKKVVKAKKTKVKAPKVYKIPLKTLNSKARKSLKWKLKDTRVPGTCLKNGCSKTGVKGLFCKKHKKILRTEQLRLNNIPWRKKVVTQGKKYTPDQPHLVYNGVATKYAVVKNKDAVRRVKKGLSIITSTKALAAAIAARKEARKGLKLKAKKKFVKPSIKTVSGKKAKKFITTTKVVDSKPHKVKVSGSNKAKKVKVTKEFDFS